MEIIALSYKIHPTDKYSCRCEQWGPVMTQGDTMKELVDNAIELTETFFEMLSEGELHKDDYPKIENVIPRPGRFVLYFNKETGKYVGVPAKKITA